MYTDLRKNDLCELAVTSTDTNGNGIAHASDGMTVFVKNSCAGDIVTAKIIKVTKSYAVAIIENLIQPSADRSADGCAVSGKCGGCSFQHITYEAECKFKKDAINAAFERIGKLRLRLSDFHPASSVYSYRNKAVYPVSTDSSGKLICGFYAKKSHRIIEHQNCDISADIFPQVCKKILEFANQRKISAYDESTGKGILRSIYMRSSSAGSIILTLITTTGRFTDQNTEDEFCSMITEAFPVICSILINQNVKNSNAVLGDTWRTIYGSGYLNDELCGKKFRISPASFWQVNHVQTEVLYGIAKKLAALEKGDTLLDLYCGTGSVGICISDKETKLFGVEIVPEAAEDARYNAKLNSLNAEYICLSADTALDDEKLKALHPDVIAIDPPRKGCGTEAAAKISSLGARRIVYISCDPATLARDLAEFEKHGYFAVCAEGVDMFPRTAHVETVVQLVRKKPDTYIDITVDMDELDLTSSEAKATYEEIKDYVFEGFGLKVSSLNIAQVKTKCGIIERENYNKPKSENVKQPQCTKDKEEAIMSALRHFKMI